MLSYDSPVSVNGQSSAASTIMSATRQNMASTPKTVRLPAPALSNGSLTNGAASSTNASLAKQHHIWLVTGPAGCGKSTVAKYLATCLHIPYIEGDEYHPQANIDKMSAGIPLTDADRWDWLTALREASIHELEQGHDGVVLTCSALKRKYRDVIRVAPYFTPNLHLHFIYLDASEEVLLQRVLARQNHYMGANMVHSQFDILEPPTKAEVDVIRVDVSRPADVVMAEALDNVLKTMDQVQGASAQK
ncbi:P-loop containing nucleoside triphosphate hydrolase protein [Lasiosphaeria miniovina]|uniref:Gluconokinase n=1 Tax=Lasiosphaeria miniovina TaxID=1954250 RepID=A0AA40EDX2_9PEZI|nr:P-loop containing nucleoside triphosphate hydrolase protein [Lasiosphaeria miniovina]KAK0733896.1 P-loop containing nucleoside triphosphate hydrolase protein [Lasiosphaeria miniovina]